MVGTPHAGRQRIYADRMDSTVAHPETVLVVLAQPARVAADLVGRRGRIRRGRIGPVVGVEVEIGVPRAGRLGRQDRRVLGVDLHLAVGEVEVQQERIAGALDAHAHTQLRMASDHGRDRLDQLRHGRRRAGRLTRRSSAQLVTARELLESVIQSASHVIVLP